MSAQGGLSSYAAVPGKYSFIHKVIDGITVTVNTVNILFNSPAFTASVQVYKALLFTDINYHISFSLLRYRE